MLNARGDGGFGETVNKVVITSNLHNHDSATRNKVLHPEFAKLEMSNFSEAPPVRDARNAAGVSVLTGAWFLTCYT